MEIELRINGSARRLDVAPRVSLLDALREYLGLTGTKKGCHQGAGGRRINPCLALAVQYEGREITTIEGVDHPLQAAFVRTDGFQCGYCTPGQICLAIGMLAEHKEGAPSAATEHLPTVAGSWTSAVPRRDTRPPTGTSSGVCAHGSQQWSVVDGSIEDRWPRPLSTSFDLFTLWSKRHVG
ncbi:2Fe-2S iron-sulfur cluster-binding protein [Streptomyces sp. ME02-8801-2C]|uniref:(2Fe-2S)-binding protein n=1 Tax=Streptomyces sp. ME02-8801-2C TaxID=3028680 RepID=UPI0029B3A9D1|nr:2Fe-2S iron-sulfur cluster-binding protein [Streptomyces sp. ME02-8801-2C]MDX3457104.1 2Fe-2S iron-sulfur cluster-binding protein [Streptomyces sp. ME02-8801-2C]